MHQNQASSPLNQSDARDVLEQNGRRKLVPEKIRMELVHARLEYSPKRTGAELARAAALFAASVFAQMIGRESGISIAVAIGCTTGLLFTLSALEMKLGKLLTMRRAKSLRGDLEGADGFLWRYKDTLEADHADGPIEIHESLLRCCVASSDGDSCLDHEDLTQYWYWVSILHCHAKSLVA